MSEAHIIWWRGALQEKIKQKQSALNIYSKSPKEFFSRDSLIKLKVNTTCGHEGTAKFAFDLARFSALTQLPRRVPTPSSCSVLRASLYLKEFRWSCGICLCSCLVMNWADVVWPKLLIAKSTSAWAWLVSHWSFPCFTIEPARKHLIHTSFLSDLEPSPGHSTHCSHICHPSRGMFTWLVMISEWHIKYLQRK